MNGQSQQGIVLLGTILLCVLLSLSGFYALRSVQLAVDAESMALLRNQTYNAAYSGLQWSARYAELNDTCPSVEPQLAAVEIESVTSLQMARDFFPRLSVTIYCQRTRHVDADNLLVYWFRAVAEYGEVGVPHFVSRELETIHVFQ